MTTDTLQAQLTILRQLQLVRLVSASEQEYTFHHALTLETAYESLLLRRRKQLHRDVAVLLEADTTLGAERAQLLAHHYWQAEAWNKAATWALTAGDQAAATFALREAMGQYDHALAAMDHLPNVPPALYCDTLLNWSHAAYTYRPRAEILDRLLLAERMAREQGDTAQLTRALEAIANVNLAQGLPSRAIPALREIYTLALADGSEARLVAPTFYLGLFELENDVHVALDYFARAAELARRYGNQDIEAYAEATRGLALARLGDAAQAQEALTKALRLLETVESPLTISEVNLYAGWTWLSLGDLARAREYGERGVQLALAADNMECVCYGFACLGFRQLQSGEAGGAARDFQESIRRAQFSGAGHIEVLGQAGLATAQFFQGDATALDRIVAAYQEARNRDLGYTAALIAQTLGSVYAQQNNAAQARTYLEAAGAYFQRNEMLPAAAAIEQMLAGLESADQTA